MKHKRLHILIIILIVLVTSGCQVRRNDLTPAEFPHVFDPSYISQEYLAEGTFVDFIDLIANGEHRFVVEAIPNNAASQFGQSDMYINLNGNHYPMERVQGTRLWYYDSTDKCAIGGYDYYFVPSSQPSSSATIKHVDLTGVGEFFWFQPLAEINLGNGTAFLGIPGEQDDTTEIVLRNLTGIPVTVMAIEFEELASAPNNDHFELSNVPALPVELACGESATFTVTRTSWEYPNESLGALLVIYDHNMGTPSSFTIGLAGAEAAE